MFRMLQRNIYHMFVPYIYSTWRTPLDITYANKRTFPLVLGCVTRLLLCVEKFRRGSAKNRRHFPGPRWLFYVALKRKRNERLKFACSRMEAYVVVACLPANVCDTLILRRRSAKSFCRFAF